MEVWVTAASNWDEPPRPPHQNILPSGAPTQYFVAEDEDWGRDSRLFIQTQGVGVDGVLATLTAHTIGDEGEGLEDEAQITLTRKQALELAYWILATLK